MNTNAVLVDEEQIGESHKEKRIRRSRDRAGKKKSAQRAKNQRSGKRQKTRPPLTPQIPSCCMLRHPKRSGRPLLDELAGCDLFDDDSTVSSLREDADGTAEYTDVPRGGLVYTSSPWDLRDADDDATDPAVPYAEEFDLRDFAYLNSGCRIIVA